MLKPAWKERLFDRRLDELRGWRRFGVRMLRIFYFAGREFRTDACFERAASLTFATIISLFPLGVLFVTITGMIGERERIIEYVQDVLIPIVSPEFQAPLEKWLDDSISRKAFQKLPTSLINFLATIGLLLAALAVLVTAERVFNRIWKAPRRRSYFQKVTAFWMILTTSPLLIFFSMAILDERDVVLSEKSISGFLVSFVVGLVAFSLLYVFLPAAKVRLRSALVGGLVAALLWGLSKRGFYLYAAGRETNFYLHVAAIPLFLVWVYINWAITLFGGEVSYVHQNLAALRSEAQSPRRARRRLSRQYLGVYLLGRLAEAFEAGKEPPTLARIASETSTEEEVLANLAGALCEEGYILENAQAPGAYALARHPRTIGLKRLVRELWKAELPGEFEPPPESVAAGAPVSARLAELFGQARGRFLAVIGELTLEDLVGSGGPAREPERISNAVDSQS